MKKIILMLLLIPKIVIADVVYTEYKEYIKGTNEHLEESDILKREEYKLYNTYIEEKEETYAQLNTLNDEYKIDLTDFYLQNNLSLNKNEYSYDYQTKCLNVYENIYDIKIKNFSSNVNLSEISYFNEEQVGIRMNVDNYLQGDKQVVFDKNLYKDFITLSNQSFITFRLLKEINLDNLNLQLYFPKQGEKIIDFTITINYNIDLYGTFELTDEDNIINITFDSLYNEFLLYNNFQTDKTCISFYSNNIPYYKHIKTTTIPLNNYILLNNIDKFILDDSLTLYNYYKRDKIEIVDNIYLENTKFNINNYIESSTLSIENLSIKENIDYQKSGTYNLEIFYKDKLLIQKPIVYKNSNQITKETTTKKSPTKNNAIRTKITTTTKKQTLITSSNVKKLNVQMKNNTNNKQKNKLILILSILIIVLSIFEMILLYVKRKYF